MKKKILGSVAALAMLGLSTITPLQATADGTQSSTDDRVIFESFSLFQPYQQTMYETLADKSAELKADGFTDVWLPPASRGGYGVTDRYDLGEFAQGPSSVDGKTTDPTATAYGTAGQLKTLMDALHQNGMSGEEDLVTNQMMNLNERQAVLVNRTDASGNLWHASGQPQIQGHVYLSYTSNSIEWDPGQHKYGLLQWDASDFNGTSLQSQGLASAILSYPDLGAASSEYANPASSDYLTVTGTGANAKLNDKSNITDKWYKFDAAKADLSTSTMNLVESAIPGDTDTYYVPADGWYCAADCEPGGSPTWYPYLINSSSFQSWLSSSDTWSKYFSSDQPTTVDAEAIATATLKAGVKDLGVLVSDYKAAEPGYNLSSEQPSNENSNSGIDSGDQFLYVNPDGSATSKGLNQGFMKSNEMLIGSDVDNANSDVQKETQHWAKWLLDTYHFDGFRFDAASFVSTAVLQQTAKTVADEPANTGSAGKLSYIESYSDSQRSYEDSVGNPQLSYDSGLQGGLQNALGASPGQRKSLQSIATSGFVNRTDNAGSTATTPNWSFVSNHDKQKDIVYPIMMSQLGVSHGDGDNSFGSAWSDAAQNAALKTYDDDVQSVTKQYAPYNVPAQYAYMLTNIDTVPTVYYGDLYQPDGDYMSQKTPYYDIITKLVNARKQLNAGGQKVLGFPSNTSSTSGGDLIASVRAGTDRSTGGVTVIGSNANLDTSITIPLGAGHANQMYRDVSGLHDEEISTDANGNLRLSIKGSATPTVNGYLGVWAPDTSAPDPTVAPTASDASATTDPGKAVTLDPDTTFGTSQTFTGVAFDKSGATTKDVPGEGTWTIALNDKGQPEAVFTPEDGFTGKTTPVPYIVTDGNGLTATANLDVTVNKPLTPPTTGDKSATTNPDTPVTLNPVTTPGSGDITDVKFVAPADGKGSLSADGKTLTVPGEGVWTIKLDDKGQPVATFAPDKDYSGPVTEQSYTVTDANELTATGKLDVTINEPPSAKDKSATTNPKTPVTLDPETGFGTSQKFTGVAFDDKGATTKTVPGEGTWTIKLGDNGQPTAVFTPVGGFTGKTTAVPYIVTDGNGLTATANLDVTVLAPPTASDKSATTDPKTPVTLDPDTTFGTSQKFTSVAFDDKGATTKDVPGEGTWTIKLNDKGQPEAVFTPVDGFTGKTTPVPYTVTDGNGLTATANLDVTVLAPPTTGDASKAINPNETATLTPKTVPGSGDITDVTFTDPAATDGGKTLTVPGEGTWTIKLGDNGQPTAVFTPVDGFTGKTTAVPYIVTDENGLTATANLDVTVLAPPTASDKSATTDPKTPVTLDPETGFGTSKKFTGVAFDDKGATTKDVPGEGSWTISLNDKGQPEAVFTPVDGFTGKTTPQLYTVTDENGLTATANLDVTVNKPLTPPTTGDKSATTNPDTPVTLNPVTTPGSAPIKSVVFDNNQPTKDVPGQGTWTIELKDGQPVATFTPDKDFTGKVTPQKYTVTDSNDKTADGTLNVTINPPAPVPPKTGDKSATTNPGKPVTLNPVTTPGSSPITSVAFDNGQLTKDVPGEGTWTVKLKDGQPVAVFTPEDGFTGKTTPQPYTVTDENGLTATGKLDVTVNTPAPVTPPTTGDRSETGEPGKPVTLNPVTKPGSAPIKSVAFDNGQPTKVVPGQGTWTVELKDGQPVVVFTPEPGFKGSPDPQKYTVKDGNGKTAEGTLTINVPAAPVTPPTTGDKSATTDPGKPVTLAPVAKPGSAPITSAVFDNGKPTKDVPGQGTWTIELKDGQPVATFAPIDGFTGKTTPQQYTVTDGNGKTATGKLDVTINKPLTPPTTGDASKTIDPNETATLTPKTVPGSGDITDVKFDNGQPTKDVPGEGTWSIKLDNGQPVATFTPVKDYSGKVTPQQYTVTDSNGKTADGTLNVTINPPAPVPPTTGDKSAVTNPGTPVTLNPVTTPGSSPIKSVVFDNGQPSKDVPNEGTWTVKLDNGQPVATFTPVKDYSGKVDPQPYTVTDGNGLTATGKLDVTVNTPPTTGDKTVTADPGVPVTLAPTAKPGSAPIRSAVFDNGKTSKTVPGEGTWTIKVVDGQPVVVFAPAEGFTGKTTPQQYTVKDENGLTADGSLDVTVNTPPAAGGETVTAEPGAPVTLTPTAKPGTAPIVSAVFDNGKDTKAVPGQGTWNVVLKDGQPVVTFTPEPGFKGSPDPQKYTVTDGNGKTAEGTLAVNVAAAPVPPKTGDKTATAKPGQPVTLTPTAKPGSAPIKSAVFDNGKDTKTVPGEGTWTIKVVDGQPVATFTPAKGFSGKATPQKYTVTDENGKTATGTLGVDVPAAPAAPGKVAPAPAAPAKPAKQPQSVLASTGASVGIALIAMLALAAAGLGLRKLSRRNGSD